ncbi:uncharacterized protein LOC113149051 [Anabas testudineus]|uniref:uncharacterized protein LOC113149051 n=1 Tax=Anabas testudineus TaxID=64144 RepID=UPI000E460C56|nr:uncharacterized protein LOC113149051 [Anabas testudineus]
MAEPRRIQMLILILTLQFKITTGQSSSFLLPVRDGDDVTLPCGKVRDDQNKCDSTTWMISGSGNSAAVPLFELGQIHKDIVKSKSDRLSVTENCSLVIKKVTDEDVGRYTCRQFISGPHYEDSVVELSVVTITEQKNNKMFNLSCSVLTRDECRHTVEWLNEADDEDVEIQKSVCSATVTFPTCHHHQKAKLELLRCNVTDKYTRKEQLFDFRLQPCEAGLWWLYIVVPVVVTALVVGVVALVRWKKTEENNREPDGKLELSLNPAETQSAPETTHDTTDPEDGVSYASINHSKNKQNKFQVQTGDEDEGDAVTYSTVKVPSSSPGASADPNNLYATIH